MNSIPHVALNNGVRDAPARLRRLPGSRRRGRAPRYQRARRRLPQHRHGRHLRQREGHRPGASPTPAWPARSFRHHQALERRPGLRASACAPSTQSLAKLGPRLPRSLPDPLAGAGIATSTLDTWQALEKTLRGRPGPRHRRLQLPARAPASGSSPTSAHRCRPSTRSSCTRTVQQRDADGRSTHEPRHRRPRPGRRSPGRRCSARSRHRAIAARLRPHAGAGRAALAPAAGQRSSSRSPVRRLASRLASRSAR